MSNRIEYSFTKYQKREVRIHYTGLLTVEPITKKSVEKIEKWQDDLWLFERDLGAYYLIDGQQRLTTSIILINELLNQFKDNEGINFKSRGGKDQRASRTNKIE